MWHEEGADEASDITENDLCIVIYDGKLDPGEVQPQQGNSYEVFTVAAKSGGYWKSENVIIFLSSPPILFSLQMDEVDLQVLHELTDDEEILAYSELCCTHASDHLRSNRLDINYTLSNECVQQFCVRKGPVFLEDATAVARQARGFNLSCLQWGRNCV